ncbi:hypothetical protein EMCRGX_G024678 [Ephydatia muelleri]
MDLPDPPATKRCSNCNHDVSINTFELHEAYCHRNVKLCPRCSATVQAQSFEEHLSGCSNEAATPLDADRDCEQSEEPTTPTTLCGVCREVVPQGKMDDHVLENHRDIPCDMCEASVPFSGLQEHIRKCHICEYCETVVPDYDRREHQENFCSAVTRKCKYCELTLNNQDYISHLEACGSRTEMCEGCMSYVTLKDMEDHTLACWQQLEGPLEPLIPMVRPPVGRGHHCRGNCCCSCCTLS